MHSEDAAVAPRVAGEAQRGESSWKLRAIKSETCQEEQVNLQVECCRDRKSHHVQGPRQD